MNKFDFVIKDHLETQKSTLSNVLFYKDFRKTFEFYFIEQEDLNSRDIISDRHDGLQRTTRTSGRIVKSDIQSHVIKQLQNMFKEIKDTGEEILCITMNKNTKNLLRIYYSYEVDHIPRNLTDEEKQIGKIVGSVMGVKIVLDNSLSDHIIRPLVRINVVKKFSKVFAT
ncbi:MAG: hypothetical protein PHF86_04270 [Candidatus Nanoarchaeia archaeon]|jgi:hypothetical protein|nr:hypothetical protein [Candidatus Nanoarchaeia archaeon]